LAEWERVVPQGMPLDKALRFWAQRGVAMPLNRMMYHLFNQLTPLKAYSIQQLFDTATVVGKLYSTSFAGTPTPNLTSSQLVIRIAAATRPASGIAEQCGGLDTAASSGEGAWYAWCKKLLSRLLSGEAVKNRVGLSYGISTWDNWSKRLANEYGVRTLLFDCYCTTENCGPTPSLEGYKTPNTRIAKCVAGEKFSLEGRDFETLSSRLSTLTVNSAFLKLDVEGSEWGSLRRLTDADLRKIDILNLKVYFCGKPQETVSDDVIGMPERVAILERLAKHFLVTARSPSNPKLWLGPTDHNLCGHSDKTGWASISYASRERVSEALANA